MSSLTETPLGNMGNYELLAEIGRGSFGKVFKARHYRSRELAAVKIVPGLLARSPVLLKRFQQECQMASKIEHPNIVRVLEYCVDHNPPFMVMELIDGASLGDMVERDGVIPEPDAIRLIVQASQGLEQIHSLGLLHRDIKPDNILVNSEGIVKITDLGLAKDMDTGIDLTKTGTGLGTPNFIAPEQFRNAKCVDRRCDIYALGAALYQMVTGVLPFADTNPVNILSRKMKNELIPPQKLVPTLNKRTITTIQQALANEPDQRFSSCWDFVASLVDTNKGLGREFDEQARKMDMWYVHFKTREGKIRHATGHDKALCRAAALGQLGDITAIRASRSMAGPFKRLCEYSQLMTLLAQQERWEDQTFSNGNKLSGSGSGLAVSENAREKDAQASGSSQEILTLSAEENSGLVATESVALEETEKPDAQAKVPTKKIRLPALPQRKDLPHSDLTNAYQRHLRKETVRRWGMVLLLVVTSALTFLAGQLLTSVLP